MPRHSARLGLAAMATLLLGAAAFAQGDRMLPPMPIGKPAARPAALAQAAPAQPPRAATAPVVPKEWTGESGASGHPLMQASEIRKAAANFESCLEGMWPLAQKRNISRASFDKYVTGLTPDLRIMDLLDAQPEFTKAFWDYLDILVSDARIQGGRDLLAKYKPVFDKVEKAYGVDRNIIVAIWGVESNYGTLGGDRPVIRSTATLACIGRRQQYFREEFLSTLEILHRGDVKPERLIGSWAGAFGPTQFMPTSFKRFAVDYDGDGHRDVVDSVGDLVASTANNLKKDGWVPGATWGYEVVVPKGFNYMLADRRKQHTIAEWEGQGLRRPNGKPFPNPHEKAYLLVPAGYEGPSFLMLQNFSVIMKYNPAEAYALAIGHLADRFRGGEAFAQPWPRHEPVLSRDERRELQELLNRKGFDTGEPNGRLGPKARAAVRDYQASVGLIPDGFASATILARLRGG
ncbi:lytic murein transglycosylase [Rhodoplanes sp. Z2-YC6860]|uniref:lytic murein transglycosylase n=1 Tax=Rhodoplanes sp. Z2-YC6860 TaxID=674703 RepID=UPI000A53CF5F|nr:lytic murein transglycosylase [Rhodoplanes sp. Z2-YC6860]